MLASEVLRRLVPSGSSALNLEALGALSVDGAVNGGGIVTFADSTSVITPAGLVSDEVDVTGLNSFNFPQLPGYFFWVIGNSRSFTKSAAGTATGGVTVKIGNNGTNDNICAASANSPTTAAHAAAVAAAGPAIGGGSLLVGPVGALIDLNTRPVGKVTVAGTGTGGFTWRCRYILLGFIIPATL